MMDKSALTRFLPKGQLKGSGVTKLVWLWVRVLAAPQLQKSRGRAGDRTGYFHAIWFSALQDRYLSKHLFLLNCCFVSMTWIGRWFESRPPRHLHLKLLRLIQKSERN
jgi:hypothetical protein